jgi:hypothetical protein
VVPLDRDLDLPLAFEVVARCGEDKPAVRQLRDGRHYREASKFLTTASGGIHESQCRHAKIESNIGNAARVRANTDDEQAARNQHAHSGLVMTQTRGRDAIFTGANSP